MSIPNRAIMFLSLKAPCKMHDLTQVRKDFEPDQKWFENLQVFIDLGYLGLDKDYPGCEVFIPIRRKPRRGKNLNLSEDQLFSPADKAHNKMVSRLRVLVEHAIGGIKRFFCLVHRWRNQKKKFQDGAILIAAGLWNLHLGTTIHY
jgi:hypothetical protein